MMNNEQSIKFIFWVALISLICYFAHINHSLTRQNQLLLEQVTQIQSKLNSLSSTSKNMEQRIVTIEDNMSMQLRELIASH